MTLETKRLILRPWHQEDAEDLYQYAKDPDVGPPAGWPPHTSVENSRQVIQTVLSDEETYAVCLKEDGKPIGSIGLHTGGFLCTADREDACELGYWIGKPFWGQGLIPEASRELLRHAFEDLRMGVVWCGHYDGNLKSRRVQEKLGFLYHHTQENVPVRLLNETRTEHAMVLTRQLWKRLNGAGSNPDRFDKQALYELLTVIPKGKVVTYGRLADLLGSKTWARAVGNALHSNPDGKKYPCYKVVNSKGMLSPGYAFGGIAAQKLYLEAEGIPVENNAVDLKKYGWE